MPIETINIGIAPNDGTGDSVRDAFNKVNGNFSQILPLSGGTLTGALVQKDKIYGPAAVVFKFTAAVCDKKGKAISRPDGRYCIMPYSVTVPVLDLQKGDSLSSSLKTVLQPLIQKTVEWHTAITAAEDFIKNWETKPICQAPKKN